MSKEMNKLLRQTAKYDLRVGLLISLIIGLGTNLIYGIIFYIGIIVGLLNFTLSVKAIKKWASSDGKSGLLLTTVLKIALVLIVALPFIWDLGNILSYVLGFSAHFAMLLYCGIKTEERK